MIKILLRARVYYQVQFIIKLDFVWRVSSLSIVLAISSISKEDFLELSLFSRYAFSNTSVIIKKQKRLPYSAEIVSESIPILSYKACNQGKYWCNKQTTSSIPST